jgi:hypothetical protein
MKNSQIIRALPFALSFIVIQSVSAGNDTTVTVAIKGTTVTVSSFPSQIDASEFQQFIDSVTTISAPYTTILIADVTADAKDDTCLTEVSIVKGIPFIKHIIYSQGIQIWLDTLTLANVSWSMWGNNASYELLMPYSALYLAKKYFTNFVGGIVSPESSEFSYFVHVLHQSNAQAWSERFRSFKGHWIWYLDYSDPGGMIWDSASKTFIHYWGG